MHASKSFRVKGTGTVAATEGGIGIFRSKAISGAQGFFIWVVLKILGPFLGIYDIMALNIWGYQQGTLILGITYTSCGCARPRKYHLA